MVTEEKELDRSRNKFLALLWTVVAVCITFVGCSQMGPISLHHAMINYDSTVVKSEKELLLLNIVRSHYDQPSHFTVCNSTSASFNFSANHQILPTWNNPITLGTTNTLGLNFGFTVSENPTMTIAPMQGKEFAQRFFKPLDTGIATTLFSQKGRNVDKLLRLTAHSFLLIRPNKLSSRTNGEIRKDVLQDVLDFLKQGGSGCFPKGGNQESCLLVNNPPLGGKDSAEPTNSKRPMPTDKVRYELFRQVVLYIKAKELNHDLFFTTLEFEEDVKDSFYKETDSKSINIKDIADALNKEYQIKRVCGGYKLVKPYKVPTVADFPADKLDASHLKLIAEDFDLFGHLKSGLSVILVLLRKDPWPIYGLFRLRNFSEVLHFLGESLKKKAGYHYEIPVKPSKYTKCLAALQPGIFDNPDLTLKINSETPSSESETPSSKYVAVSVNYDGEPFSISWEPTRWDIQVFNLLYAIFQMNRVEPKVSAPSTVIAK